MRTALPSSTRPHPSSRPEGGRLWDQLFQSTAKLVERRSNVLRVMGLVGNLLFVTGSLCFMWRQTELAGVWQFLVGSLLLMLRTAATAVKEVTQEQADSATRTRFGG